MLTLPIVVEQPVAVAEMDFFRHFMNGSLLGVFKLRPPHFIIKRCETNFNSCGDAVSILISPTEENHPDREIVINDCR